MIEKEKACKIPPRSPDRLINAFDLRAFQLWLSEDLLYVTDFKAAIG